MTRSKRKGSPSKTEKDTSSSDPAAAEDEELVTLTTLKHMLSIQESMMRSILDSFVSSVTSRVDDLVKTVASLQASLEFTQKDVVGMKTMATDLKVAEEEVGKLRTALETQTSQMEYLENQSRRNNIRVSGIPESPGETWDSAESKVKQAIEEELGIAVDIERAHRVNRRHPGRNGWRGDPGKPRTIVCRLYSWKQKEAVLRKARKEKPQGLFISEDLAAATLEKRATQLDKLREAKRAGKTAYFVLDRLIIRSKPPDSAQQ